MDNHTKNAEAQKDVLSNPALPEELLTGWLLAIVAREPKHGYAVAKEMNQLRWSLPHQTTIYRHLSSLEEKGYLDSKWTMRSSGPPIRTYHITEQGREELGNTYSAVTQLQRLCRVFLDEVSELL